MLPEKLRKKLAKRIASNRLRSLPTKTLGIDFHSNDYLGFARREKIRQMAAQYIKNAAETNLSGATGSRLISGNSKLATQVEKQLTSFHESEAGLLFNSGYDANIGVFSTVPQRGDTVLYDELIHASIRDGIRLSFAQAAKFKHNDYPDLESKLKRAHSHVYIAVESLYSMDGDSPDLQSLVALAEKYKASLIVDEAHATGVLGKKGVGLVRDLNLQDSVFARIHTFGKAIGAHGAIVLGSQHLIRFLLNFAHSFIYTTALPPHSLATVRAAYDELGTDLERKKLMRNVDFFLEFVQHFGLERFFKNNRTPIQVFEPQEESVCYRVDKALGQRRFLVKLTQPPTVSCERLRICLHSFNRQADIKALLQTISQACRPQSIR